MPSINEIVEQFWSDKPVLDEWKCRYVLVPSKLFPGYHYKIYDMGFMGTYHDSNPVYEVESWCAHVSNWYDWNQLNGKTQGYILAQYAMSAERLLRDTTNHSPKGPHNQANGGPLDYRWIYL